MKLKLKLLRLLALMLAAPLPAQDSAATPDGDRKYVPMTTDDVFLKQMTGAKGQPEVIQKRNARLNTLREMSHQAQDYALGSGDVIEVTVIGVPTLENKEFSLDSQGKISLPYVNVVDLLGLTAREAEKRIAALFEVSLVVDPEVTVRVKSYKSQFFYIFGAVNAPGTKQLTGETYVLDALTMAGGLLEKAESQIQIHRAAWPAQPNPAGDPSKPLQPDPTRASGASETIEVDLSELLDYGDLSRNIRIHPGDVISIPERKDRFFYVLGDVEKPGAYSMRHGENVTLSKAIATAGGVLPSAAGNKTTIMRPNADGVSATQINVDATAILKGRQQDVTVSENDVVLVPGSASKTISKSFLGGLSSFLTTLLIIGVR